jgi:dihydroorotate dehydrogenase (fumarate)
MDLSTTYMGLKLKSPLIAGASPLSRDLENIEALARAGAGAVVMHSVFQEQLADEEAAMEYMLGKGTGTAEGEGYFANVFPFKVGPELYLDNIAAAKRAVDIPIVASLNGFSLSGWVDFARKIQEAGADALELNPYQVPTAMDVSGGQIEEGLFAVVTAVKSAVDIPVVVKLSPFWSNMAYVARRLDVIGVDGLHLFNRFYQPDLDVENLEVVPSLTLSSSYELRLPLRWVALLHGRVKAALIGGTGVHTGLDAAKMILAGADAVCLVSELLKNGVERIGQIREELANILAEKEYNSVAEARGVLSQKNCPDPAAFERANYMKIVQAELPANVGVTSPGPPMMS